MTRVTLDMTRVTHYTCDTWQVGGDLWTAFRQPTLLLLVLAASVRQIAGLAWANNNVNYFEQVTRDTIHLTRDTIHVTT